MNRLTFLKSLVLGIAAGNRLKPENAKLKDPDFLCTVTVEFWRKEGGKRVVYPFMTIRSDCDYRYLSPTEIQIEPRPPGQIEPRSVRADMQMDYDGKSMTADEIEDYERVQDTLTAEYEAQKRKL